MTFNNIVTIIVHKIVLGFRNEFVHGEFRIYPQFGTIEREMGSRGNHWRRHLWRGMKN